MALSADNKVEIRIWRISGLRLQHNVDLGRKNTVDLGYRSLFRIDATEDPEGFIKIVGWEGSNEVFIDHALYFRIKSG